MREERWKWRKREGGKAIKEREEIRVRAWMQEGRNGGGRRARLTREGINQCRDGFVFRHNSNQFIKMH